MLSRRSAALVFVAVLGAAPATPSASQDARGQIAGQVTDFDGGVIPGATVTVEARSARRQVVTNSEGRFVIDALPLDSYSVQVTLTGFLPRSGAITLSPAVRRAHLQWSLSVGCLAIVDRVGFRPRDAARRADAFAHVRVTANTGPIQWSRVPDCAGETLQAYAVAVQSSVAAARAPDTKIASEIVIQPPIVPLTPGREYLIVLWQGRFTNGDVVLPIVDGRISAPADKELGGLRVDDALALLAKWSRESVRR